MVLRRFGKVSPLLGALLPLDIPQLLDHDKIKHQTPTEEKTEIPENTETGWSRVKRMFQLDEFGNVTEECNTILQVGAMSSFVGALYGGVLSSRTAYIDFMKNNQATKFKDHFEAKRKLQDAITLSFGRGAFRWGWRLTLFCTTFVGATTIIAEYRGKNGILEYSAAGAISGMLYKFNLGPKGWIVGGGLGCALGTMAGAVTAGLLYLTGMSMKEARYWQSRWRHARKEQFNKGLANRMKENEPEVLKTHEQRVGEHNLDIQSVDKQVVSDN